MNRQEYQKLVDGFTDWTLTRNHDLAAEDPRPPLVVPLTVTFRPRAVRPDRVLLEFERLYVRLCRLLVNNPERPSKRRLLPWPSGTIPRPAPTAPGRLRRLLQPPVRRPARPLDRRHPSRPRRPLHRGGRGPRGGLKGIPRRTGDPVRLGPPQRPADRPPALRQRLAPGRPRLRREPPTTIESSYATACPAASICRHGSTDASRRQEKHTIPITQPRKSRRAFVQSGFREVRTPAPQKRAADLTEASRFYWHGPVAFGVQGLGKELSRSSWLAVKGVRVLFGTVGRHFGVQGLGEG